MTTPEVSPLYLMIGDHVGPLHPELLQAWERAGSGGACPRCSGTVEEWWFGSLVCPACEREYMVALGCRCGGTGVCPECLTAGATATTREPRCNPNCSTLCHTCHPDD